MIQLTLTTEQAATLRDILDAYVSDLSMEIAHTDRLDFRVGLKRRKAIAAEVASRLESELTTATT